MSKSRKQQMPARFHPNYPDIKVRVGKAFYVEAFNCLVASLISPDSLKLGELEDLPGVIKAYEASATLAREACDVQMYARYAQIVAFLKKLELPLFGAVAEENALVKWYESEARCKEMNAKCVDILTHPLTHSHQELASLLERLRVEILSLLGEVPPDLDQVTEFMRFGPKSDLTHALDEGSVPYKLLAPSTYPWLGPEITWLYNNTMFRCLWGLKMPEALCNIASLTDDWIAICDHAKYSSVPKKIDENRPIELGPSIPGLLQQAYDGFIRRRLREGWGLDLRNQEPNKVLARIGSERGNESNSVATIDLQSASDSVSYGLVGMLLPRAWFKILSPLRAKSIEMADGTIVKLEKFSSMGNALTFSLQTLIFSAVVRATLRAHGWEGSKWRVYGDDIIVPCRIFDEVCRNLRMLGFVINESKSFSEGHFRESCGGDYLLGVDVRPLYIKKPIKTVADLYKYLNLIQVFAMRGPIPASGFKAVYEHFLRAVPKEFLFFGDSRYALDSCVWTPWSVVPRFVLRLREQDVKLPDKLAYLSLLFLPNAGTASDCRRFWALIPGPKGLGQYCPSQLRPDVSWLKHLKVAGPLVRNEAGYVLRRPRDPGALAQSVPAEKLPFNPMLMLS